MIHIMTHYLVPVAMIALMTMLVFVVYKIIQSYHEDIMREEEKDDEV